MAELKKISLDEFEFDYWVEGEASNELVILLHGFPEASAMWLGLMASLARQGYFSIAPDMR